MNETSIQTPTENPPLVEISHVSKVFSRGRHTEAKRALDDVSLEIYPGEVMGIIGYSGAGKSTLLRMINGLEKPSSGEVRVFGTNIETFNDAKLRPTRQKIGMIFQQFNLFSSKTVAENIAYPLLQDRWREDFINRQVSQLLRYVGLYEYKDSYPESLSGGQKQRVGIARALALQPQILLADEATSALDPTTTDEVLSLLKQVNKDMGITVILITHQMSVVAKIADRVAVMENGKIVEEGKVYKVFATPRQAITRSFVASAIDSCPSEAEINKLRTIHPKRLITVIMRDEDPELGITPSGTHISRMLTHRSITNNILCGGVKSVGSKSLGSFTYELYGEDGLLDSYVEELKQENIIVDFGTKEHPVRYADALSSAYKE